MSGKFRLARKKSLGRIMAISNFSYGKTKAHYIQTESPLIDMKADKAYTVNRGTVFKIMNVW